MPDKPTVRIDLTPAQQEQIERVSGRPVTAFEVELDGFEQLEERIAPLTVKRSFLSNDLGGGNF